MSRRPEAKSKIHDKADIWTQVDNALHTMHNTVQRFHNSHEAWQNVSIAIKKDNDAILEAIQNLKEIRKKIQKQLDALNTQCVRVHHGLVETTNSITEKDAKLQELNEQNLMLQQAIQEKEISLSQQSEALTNLQARLDGLTQDLSTAASKDEISARVIQDMKRQYQDLETAREKVAQALSEKEAVIAQLQTTMNANIMAQETEFKRQLGERDATLQEKEAAIAELTAGKVAQSKTHEATLERQLNAKNAQIAKLEKDLAEKQIAWKDGRKQLTVELETKAGNHLKSIQELQEKLKKQEESFNQTRTEYQALHTMMQKIKRDQGDEIANLNALISKHEILSQQNATMQSEKAFLVSTDNALAAEMESAVPTKKRRRKDEPTTA